MHPRFRGGASATIRLWSLSEDALVEENDAEGSLVVVTRWGEFDIRDADAVVRESLWRMTLGPVSLHNITATPVAREPAEEGGARRHTDETNELERVLSLLSGSVVHSLGLHDGQVPLLSVAPAVARATFRPESVPVARPVRLSRFVALRVYDGELLLESPRTPFRVMAHQPLARNVVTLLVAPLTIPEIASNVRFPESVVADVVAHLVASGVALVGDEEGQFVEDDDPALRQWSHHELLFHARSRSRQGNDPSDAVVGYAGERTPPVTKPLPSGPRFSLFRPEDPSLGSPPLTELLETDHTCPELSARTVTAEQLGELLFRSARVRSVGSAHLHSGVCHEASQRPYFNIAGLYELELYLGLNRCAGLSRGIYHYDPLGHALTLINEDESDLAELSATAMAAAAGTRYPAALLLLTARLERTSWAFGGASYSTALMHVGALQQTLYLAAKAMGLSAHGVPARAGDAVSRALRLDWPAEVGVGECVVDRPS